MTVFITQLIYIIPGAEKVFDEFESMAIPIISLYNGKLLLRVRPNENTWIEGSLEIPHEIHLVEFASEEDFQRFLSDPTRKGFLHLKERSIRTMLLIQGNSL